MKNETKYFVQGGQEILLNKSASGWFLNFLFEKCGVNKFSLSGNLKINANGKIVNYWIEENKDIWSELNKFYLNEIIDSNLYGHQQGNADVFRHRFYKLNNQSLNFLKERELTIWCFVNNLPDDLCFYKDNELHAEIIGHELMIILHLPKRLLEKFKKFEQNFYLFPRFADIEFGETMDEFHKVFKGKESIYCLTRLIEKKKNEIKYEVRYDFPMEKYHAFITFQKGITEKVGKRKIEIYKNNRLVKQKDNINKKEELFQSIKELTNSNY